MYIEYYFIENLLINYIIISCTTILTKSINSKNKKILGATLGAVYSVLYIYPQFDFMFSLPFKIIIMTLITLISFSYSNKKEYTRIIIVFYLVNVFISGSTFFIIYFTGIKHTKVSIIIVCAYVSCELLKYIYKDIKTLQYIKKISKNIVINLLDEKIECNALIDSGNLLKDPTTGNEVIVIKPRTLRKVIGHEIEDFEFENLNIVSVENIISKLNENLKSKIRIIPYQHAGSVSKGIIVGLKCDYIEIDNNKIGSVVVAVSNFDNEDCDAIINPILLENLN